ncbi:alpha/beta fold hydrolase [Schumannella sp. 10F1B-5-1]|uniref:alpha/beta fold hydrolase n=1 Tax=Schumannella sp. 10F1B-5-1 TaxID=2590780 RepID=UPI0011312115|nr:alpha/beta fold hydrolase [Schumannella sp. 10F1B-5-1]TPW78432.1 lysophospholipase [Schumannella sp. 10F1B-5-1]
MPRFTVERIDDSYVDERGVTIHFSIWKAPAPTAIVQLAHGVGEHGLRYEQTAQDLVNAGFTVYADDHRGHGRTGLGQHGGDHRRIGRLGVGGLRATVDALRQFTGIIRESNPGVPLVLLGHSWGSLMAQMIIADTAGDYDAVVLSGTAFRTLRDMNGGDLAKRFAAEGPNGWLSRDPAVHAAFDADPLTTSAKVLKLFGLRDTLRLLGTPTTKLPKDVPLLILIGSDDTLGGPASVEKLATAYRERGGLSDVTVKIYDGARHEVFNETNRDEVVADLAKWMNDRLRYRPPVRRR